MRAYAPRVAVEVALSNRGDTVTYTWKAFTMHSLRSQDCFEVRDL